MSDPNQLADEAFAFSHDSDDDVVSSVDEQVTQQPTEQPSEQPEAAAEKTEQPVEAAPEQPSEPEQAEQGEEDGRKQHLVPVSELQKERQKRQEEAKLRELAEANAKEYKELVERISTQPPAQPPQPTQPQEVQLPDPYEDPEAYTEAVVQQRLGPIQQQMMAMQLNMSERMAVQVHGQQAVEDAFDAVKKAGNARQFLNSPDAYGEMVKWHKDQLAINEFGNDPEAYRERIKAEIRQELLSDLKANGLNGVQADQASQPVQHAQPQSLPSSLVDAPAQGVQGRQLSQQALADDIFRSDRNRHSDDGRI